MTKAKNEKPSWDTPLRAPKLVREELNGRFDEEAMMTRLEAAWGTAAHQDDYVPNVVPRKDVPDSLRRKRAKY